MGIGKMEKLECENDQLRSKVEAIEKYERGDCLELHNVPQKENENTEELVATIAAEMGLELTVADINTAYCLPVKKEKQGTATPLLYVKFIKRNHKRLVYMNRIKKPVTHQHLGFGTSGKIYIPY